MSPKSLLFSLFALVLILCLCPINLFSFQLTKKTLFDAGHFPLFFVFSFGLSLFFKLSRPNLWRDKRRRTLLGVLLFCVAFAGAIEVVQPLFDRSEEFDDFIVGSLGAFFGVYGAAVFLRETAFRQKFFFCCYTLLLSFFLLRNLPFAYEADVFERTQFPLLGSFEDEHELAFWEPVPEFRGDCISVRDQHPTHGKKTLRIVPRPEGPMGIRYHIGTQDWSGFQMIVLDVFLEGEPTTVYSVLESKQGWPQTRLQSEVNIRLESGENHLQIPLHQFSNAHLQAISKFSLLLGIENESSRAIYIDAVKLQ